MKDESRFAFVPSRDSSMSDTSGGDGADHKVSKASRLQSAKKSGKKLKVKLSGDTRAVMSTLRGLGGAKGRAPEGDEGGI